jgi:ribonuclease P protein component
VRSERLGGDERLRRPPEYLRCYRQGRRRPGRYVLVYFRERRDEEAATPSFRLGLTASRKVGSAVVRNRLKRRAREIVRRSPWRELWTRCDVVVHFQPAAAGAPFAALRSDLQSALARGPGPTRR